MQDKDYLFIVLKKLEPTFDILLPISGLLSLIMGGLNILSKGRLIFIVLDTVMALMLWLMFAFRKQIPMIYKVIIIMMLTTLLGCLAFYINGLSGAGMTIFILTSIVSVIFLPRKISLGIICFNLLFLLGITLGVGIGVVTFAEKVKVNNYNVPMWFIQVVAYGLMVIIFIMTNDRIKNYMIRSIKSLEEQMNTIIESSSELKRQNDALKKSEESIHQLAYFDLLTGLPNKHYFQNQVNDKLSEGNFNGYLVLVDLREFKVINSMYGNLKGDEILIAIGKALFEGIGPLNHVGRFGGNEFVLLLDKVNNEQINYLLQQITMSYIERNPQLNGFKRVKFFIAMVKAPAHGDGFEQLIAKAILAMKEAKDKPQLQYVEYSEVLYRQIFKDEQLKNLIEIAIQDDEFSVYYQKKVDSLSGKIVGVEALARWFSDELGTIGPNQFIPIIEKSRLSIPFGEMIIEKVFLDYEQIKRKWGDDISIAINISPTHLVSVGFVSFCQYLKEKYPMVGEDIILEITESVMLQGVGNVEKVIKQLKDLGMKIALDDFGSGYSSLNYIAHLTLDELKIDKSFIDQLAITPHVGTLIEAIVKIATVYQFSIVAEGVETKEQVDALKKLGATIIQGYYYSIPEKLM